MILGFTGTRKGMTLEQKTVFPFQILHTIRITPTK